MLGPDQASDNGKSFRTLTAVDAVKRYTRPDTGAWPVEPPHIPRAVSQASAGPPRNSRAVRRHSERSDSQGQYQTYDYSYSGPTYGGGHDLNVGYDLNSGYSYGYYC